VGNVIVAVDDDNNSDNLSKFKNDKCVLSQFFLYANKSKIFVSKKTVSYRCLCDLLLHFFIFFCLFFDFIIREMDPGTGVKALHETFGTEIVGVERNAHGNPLMQSS
jgi:hypothetical protein